MSGILASFSVDGAVWAQFVALCDEATETPDTALRELLRLEIQRRQRRKARRDEVVDERLLVRLRLLVAEALAEASDWPSYRAALRRRGLDIVPKGGGLGLVEHPSGRPLAKGSQAGPGYLDLVRRFGAILPGHPNRAQAERVLRQGLPRMARHLPPDEDFTLIEPF